MTPSRRRSRTSPGCGSPAPTSRGKPFSLYDKQHNHEWRAQVIPANLQNISTGATETGYVLVAVSSADTDQTIARFTFIFLGFGASVILLGAMLTRLLVTATFDPLRDVEDTAARFAAGDFNQRLDADTPNTEVGRLNRSLNAMLERIDSAFEDRERTIAQMRRFVGDASHELRTPLVSLRGYAELYRMGALRKEEDVAQAMERIEKEAQRMGLLVQDLLQLARIDESKPLELGPVDLVAIARDSALDTMASNPDREIQVLVEDSVTGENVPQAVRAPSAFGRAPSPRPADAVPMSPVGEHHGADRLLPPDPGAPACSAWPRDGRRGAAVGTETTPMPTWCCRSARRSSWPRRTRSARS